MSAAFPWLFLGLLLVLSGFFSASETALFSLTAEDREAAQPRVRRLLAAHYSSRQKSVDPGQY